MKEIIKKRTIKIKGLEHEGYENDLQEGLEHMDGIKNVQTDKNNSSVIVKYDLMKTNLQTINNTLQALKYNTSYGLFNKIRYGWIHICEENEYNSQNATTGPVRPEPESND